MTDGNGEVGAITPAPWREIGPDLVDAAAEVGRRLGVCSAIHDRDFIFWYIHDSRPPERRAEAVEEYLTSGIPAALLLKEFLAQARVAAILASRPNPGEPVSTLEFAAGYGRVTRHFSSVLPELDVTACDIHDTAVDFLRNNGLPAMASSHDPHGFALGRAFNVIYAFSFFTHMPRASWTAWLEALGRHLSENGVLIFTAHGEVSQALMQVEALEADGFFFHPHSEQADLPGAEYGNTVTAFDFVHAQLHEAGLELVQFRQAGAGHHDVYVVRKPAGEPTRYRSRFEAERTALERANERLQREVAALLGSTSWRIMSPVRSVAKFVKRGGD